MALERFLRPNWNKGHPVAHQLVRPMRRTRTSGWSKWQQIRVGVETASQDPQLRVDAFSLAASGYSLSQGPRRKLPFLQPSLNLWLWFQEQLIFFLFAAILRHVVKEPVQLKVYADNSAAVCIASRQGGVGRIRHLDGRLLWIQQRQGRDFQPRRVDTAWNPADMGTKCLAGKRVKMLLILLGFTNDMESLGWYELEEEIVKKQNKEKIQAIRKVGSCRGFGN